MAFVLRPEWNSQSLSCRTLVMTERRRKAYPDVSDILARKREGEKIARMEALRERLAPLKRARDARRTARTAKAKRDGDGG